MVDLVFRNKVGAVGCSDNFFRLLAEKTVEELGRSDEHFELSVSLVSKEEIAALNEEYRGKNEVTDVLSFPVDEGESAVYGIISLGDIFICFDAAQSDAVREGVSLEKKLARLAVHGFLHLFGYDHERSEKETGEMNRLEDKILVSINF